MAHHNPRLMSTYEILGSYFVDIFYNVIYHSARQRAGPEYSLTDEYCRQVQVYITAVKTSRDDFRKTLNGLYHYYQTETRYGSGLSFHEFVEKIVPNFVPEEYYANFATEHKDDMLGKIIVDLIASLGAFATSPEILPKIIDLHDKEPALTIRRMQDRAISYLHGVRTEIHNRFLCKIGQAKETVSIECVDELRKEIKSQVRQKCQLKADLENARAEISKYKQREARFRRLIQMIRSEQTEGRTAAALSARVPAPPLTVAEADDAADGGNVSYLSDASSDDTSDASSPPGVSVASDASDASDSAEDTESSDSPPPRRRRRPSRRVHPRAGRRTPRRTGRPPPPDESDMSDASDASDASEGGAAAGPVALNAAGGDFGVDADNPSQRARALRLGDFMHEETDSGSKRY